MPGRNLQTGSKRGEQCDRDDMDVDEEPEGTVRSAGDVDDPTQVQTVDENGERRGRDGDGSRQSPNARGQGGDSGHGGRCEDHRRGARTDGSTIEQHRRKDDTEARDPDEQEHPCALGERDQVVGANFRRGSTVALHANRVRSTATGAIASFGSRRSIR